MLGEQRRVQRGSEPDPARHLGTGRDLASGGHAWTWVPTDSVLCVLTDDESMTGVRWKQRTRVWQLPGPMGVVAPM